MGIAMNGVIADNVRATQASTNDNVIVRIEMHFDGEGEDIRATGDVELSMHPGRHPAPPSIIGYSIDLINALTRIADMGQREAYKSLIAHAATAAAAGNGSHVAVLPGREPAVTYAARSLDLSE